MGRRRKRTRDPNVVKTRPDFRRADRENDDTLDLTDEETAVRPMAYTTAPISRCIRSKLRKSSGEFKRDGSFPFLDLPPEIRNIVYRNLLVSKSDSPIRLDIDGIAFPPGGIETAILQANRKVYNDAVKILYDENEFLVGFSRFESELPGVIFRRDDPRDANVTSRQLRNGRSVGMVNHTGLIYRSAFYHLRNVELHLDITDARSIIHSDIPYFSNCRFQGVLETLYKTITDASSKELSAIQATNRNWSLVFHSLGDVRFEALKMIVKPLHRSNIVKAVQKGNLKMVLKGDFPRNWDIIFREFVGPGLSFEDFRVVKTVR